MFDVDPAQNGQMASIMDFHYSVLHIVYFRQHLQGGALAEVCTLVSV